MFNTLILLEGRTDNPHYVTALVVAKERGLGTYSSSVPDYLKKYHDYILGVYDITGTASVINAALNQTLGDMLPLADEIASVMNRTASIGGVLVALLESDIVYWVDVELTTNCILDTGSYATCAPPEVISEQPSLSINNQTASGASQSAQSTSTNLKVDVYWRAVYCISSYRGISYGAVCSNTYTYSSLPVSKSTSGTVSGLKVYAQVSIKNAQKNVTASVSLTSPSSGSDSDTGYSHAKAGAWTVYAETLKDHPCYAGYMGFDDSVVDWPLLYECVAYNKWSFSGSVSAKDASTSTKSQNKSPTANAGNDFSVEPNAPVELDGSGSSDPERTSMSYLWKQVSGNQTVQLSNTGVAKPTFTAPGTADVLKFKLTVSDGSLSSHDYVTVTVNTVPELTVNDYGATIFRHSGLLWPVAKFDFEGTDRDEGNTLTLSVSGTPSVKAAALTDCGTEPENTKIYREYDDDADRVINSSKTPVTG